MHVMYKLPSLEMLSLEVIVKLFIEVSRKDKFEAEALAPGGL